MHPLRITTRSSRLLVHQLVLIFPLSLLAELGSAAENAADVEQRLARFAQFLSSEELEGRGLGTTGLELAAEAIADQFRDAGLDVATDGGDAFQELQVTTAAELGPDNHLKIVKGTDGDGNPDQFALELHEDYNPLAIGGASQFDLPIAFAGYGITSQEAGYDDYADMDVTGKAVLILRHEPQQDNPHSAFAGTENSPHATFRQKVSNAYQHGAAAVIFVTGQVEIDRRVDQVERSWHAAVAEIAALRDRLGQDDSASEEQQREYRKKIAEQARRILEFDERRQEERDPVLSFSQAGIGTERREIPVVHVRRAIVDRVLQEAGSPSLAELEQQIDEGPTPRSFLLQDWRLVGRTDIERREATVKNVIGVLKGKGPHANEAIVIGAHYDHLGRGEEGSAAPGSREIHNGADDNASGVAVLVEIARGLAAHHGQLDRTIIFAAFTAEERGLLGSAHYVQNPIVPLESTVAMINLDMVGRLQEDKLIVNGTGTAEEFDEWIDTLNVRHRFEISKSEGGFGPSDHTSFYAQKVPVLHFFTGLHSDYHKPSDDFQNLSIVGMRRVAEFVTDLGLQIADADAAPKYVAAGRDDPGPRPTGSRPYFGSIPQFPDPGDGYALSGVTPESPAARGGLQAGDKIVRLGDYKIGNLEDFDGALRKYNAGDRVEVAIIRNGQSVTLEVILDPPK